MNRVTMSTVFLLIAGLILVTGRHAAWAQAAVAPAAEKEKTPATVEYRDLQPTIDTVEPIRLLSTNRAKALESEVQKAYARLAPSIVRIWTAPAGKAFSDQGIPLGGAFSGVIIDRSGLVATCAHPAYQPGSPVAFELFDGRRVTGKMLGRFEVARPGEGEHPDLGLAKIEERGDWKAVALAERPADAGSVCLAIGYPGSLHPGRPPALRLGRVLPALPGLPWVRATTSYEGGDSGGPLFDLQGRLLGVLNGGEEFAYTQYESISALQGHRAQLETGKIVSAPRPGVRTRKASLRDPAAFAPAADLEDAVTVATIGVVRILDGTHEVASGLVIGSDGWVITKRSLLPAHSDLKCLTFYSTSGRVLFPAQVVAGSTEHDLALLKMDSHSGGPSVEWATADPSVGQLVASFHHGRSLFPTTMSVVAAQTQSEPPRFGDVAQFPYYFEKGPTGAAVIARGEFQSAEGDLQREPLQMGDIITHVEGKPTPTIEEFGRALMPILYSAGKDGEGLDTSKPAPGNFAGEPLRVTVARGGEAKTLNVMRIHSTVQGPLFWHMAPKSVRRDGFPQAFSIDARIRPDQCGAPVVGLDGRVLGIAIARVDTTRTLVLPARVVRQVVDELRSQSKDRR
jgi:serine protease Do